MRAREECRGENCRRADIPEMERGRLECGSLLPLLRGIASLRNDRVGVGVAIAEAAASRRTSPSCKSFAKCRRADNSQKMQDYVWGGPMSSGGRIVERGTHVGAKIVGAPTFSKWNAGFGVAG